MARTTHVVITDDMDGSEGAQEVSFAFQGTEYTIDLGDKNLAKLEKALTPFIEAGSKVSARRSTRRGSGSTSGKSDAAAIRAWAKENYDGDVPDRGRVPQAVVDAYNAR